MTPAPRLSDAMDNNAMEVDIPQTDALEVKTPTMMHKFMQFPAEVRLNIWEIAMAEVPPPYRPKQRFRFNIVYDAARVKPNQNASSGWVACFSPVKGRHPQCNIFLRASFETRQILLRSISMLTVHELPINALGQYMAPRECQIPFDLKKGYFCVEGITHALEEAQRDKEDKNAVWDPQTLPLARLLDNAHGLQFAHRIKHFAIIPHPSDFRLPQPGQFPPPGHFFQTKIARNLAVVAQRFPILTSLTSVVPFALNPGQSQSNRFDVRGRFVSKTFSLVGKRKGRLSKMSVEDRDALFEKAWIRIFESHYRRYRVTAWDCDFSRLFIPELFDGSECVV